MHSAPSSVQSLHFGLVPSHRDFRERHISHCSMMLAMQMECQSVSAYCYRSPPPRIVDTGVRASPLQGVDPIITILSVLEAVGHGFPVA